MVDWDSLEWVGFDAPVEPLVWGRSTYTIIRADERLADAARAAGTRRAGGWIDEVEVNVGLNRADVLDDAYLYCGPALQRRLGVRVGDAVRLRLRPVDPDLVPLPADVAAALDERGVLDVFLARRPAERRRLLMPVEDAAREETRRRRVEALVRQLG